MLFNLHGIGDKIVPSRSSEENKCCVQDSIHMLQNPEIFISFLLFTVLKVDRFDLCSYTGLYERSKIVSILYCIL